MTPIVWVAVILGLVIVCLSVGIPYWFTHYRMAEHYDHSQGQAYLEGTGRTVEDVAQGRTGHPWRRRPARIRWRRPLAGTARRETALPGQGRSDSRSA